MTSGGANTFTGGFFPDSASGEWLKLKRYNLKRKRLSREMAELEAQAVGESDAELFMDWWRAYMAQR